jgi:predicted Fe-Mo cluster-binding NifX family protein
LFVTLLFVISFSGLPVFGAVQLKGDLITVEAEGFAPIVNGAINAAKEEAKRSAYRDALEKALGAYVTGITEMQNYMVVKDKVFSQTTGIVKKFDIIREKAGEDGILYISAICQVGQAALDGVLGPAVLDALGNPRLMVLIDERISEKNSFLSTAESEVLRVFEKAGYFLVDSAQAAELKDIDLNAIYAKNDPEAYRQIARDYQADVLIYGKAYGRPFTTQRIEGIPIYGVISTVQLKAVMSNTAHQLGSETVEERSKGISAEDGAIKGLRIAAEKASTSIVNKIAYALISGSVGGIPGRMIKVRISNLSFQDAKVLKENLQGLPGVTGVYQRLFRERKLELDVVSDKTAEDIASVLSDLGYEINDLSSGLVEGNGK